MKALLFPVIAALPFSSGVLHAEGPTLPGTPYTVHDMERPQPRVVETAGAVVIQPPSDATILFNGENLDAWMQNAKKPAWTIENGAMIATGSEITTKESFGPIQLHAEWRLPADREVDGQKGGNSGIFLMGLYEIQVVQSNNNKTYPDGQATALYGQLPPLVNATSPQGEWNSYEIFFQPPVYGEKGMEIPAKVTVIHNGVVVQNGETFLGPTRHKKLSSYPAEHPTTAPISLQFHGDPVEYRNIWVRPLGKRDGK